LIETNAPLFSFKLQFAYFSDMNVEFFEHGDCDDKSLDCDDKSLDCDNKSLDCDDKSLDCDDKSLDCDDKSLDCDDMSSLESSQQGSTGSWESLELLEKYSNNGETSIQVGELRPHLVHDLC
jgi:hypothetical protein